MGHFFHRSALLACVLLAAGAAAPSWGGALTANTGGWAMGQAGSATPWPGAGAPPLLAASKTTPKTAKKPTRKKTKAVTVPERMPNGETVTNRERRLVRECKGRPNAGACLGYAS